MKLCGEIIDELPIILCVLFTHCLSKFHLIKTFIMLTIIDSSDGLKFFSYCLVMTSIFHRKVFRNFKHLYESRGPNFYFFSQD